jgi:hypothetical protein
MASAVMAKARVIWSSSSAAQLSGGKLDSVLC